MDKIVVV